MKLYFQESDIIASPHRNYGSAYYIYFIQMLI